MIQITKDAAGYLQEMNKLINDMKMYQNITDTKELMFIIPAKIFKVIAPDIEPDINDKYKISGVTTRVSMYLEDICIMQKHIFDKYVSQIIKTSINSSSMLSIIQEKEQIKITDGTLSFTIPINDKFGINKMADTLWKMVPAPIKRDKYFRACCPKCNDIIPILRANHCMKCGQMLDWSLEEDENRGGYFNDDEE